MCAVPAGASRGRWIPGTGVTDGCKPTCGGLELIYGPLQEQRELLTSELPLQARRSFLWYLFSLIRYLKENASVTESLATGTLLGTGKVGLWEFRFLGNSQHTLVRYSLFAGDRTQPTLTSENTALPGLQGPKGHP